MNEQKRYSFDAYCKRLLRNAAANAHKARKRRAERTVQLSALSQNELNRLSYCDDYELDKRVYWSYGRAVEIRSMELASALEQLTQTQRDILLLSCCFGLKDTEIAAMLSLPRSTVQYRRTAAIGYIRKIVRNYDDCLS